MLTADQKQLILESEFSAIVLGRGEEFVIVRLQCDDDDATGHEAIAQGLRFCGVLAMRDGAPVAKVEPSNPGAIYTMMFAGLRFAHMVVERERPRTRTKGDSVDFLSRLFALDDPRTN
jgi:hypothetical protein